MSGHNRTSLRIDKTLDEIFKNSCETVIEEKRKDPCMVLVGGYEK